MSRLVDADDLMAWSEIVPLTDDGGIDINDFEEKLKSMPTIEAEPQWIPCSERMPNDDEDYLVTDGESMAVGYYRTDAKAWDNANFGWLEHREETSGINKVIAWMPLPEPYKVEDEDFPKGFFEKPRRHATEKKDLWEVLKCEHCKYAKPIDSEWLECQHDKRVMKPTGFCSWAESKEDEKDDGTYR